MAACTAESSEVDTGGDAITRNAASTFELRFTGDVVTSSDETPRMAIATQLQYMQGALTTELGGNAQVGMPTLTNVREFDEDGKKRITYDVVLSALALKSRAVPETYDVVLPRDVTKLNAFNNAYDGECGKNEYGRETFWHDFNPKAAGCALNDADVMRAKASVKPHPQETQGKFPEYDKVWEDDSLDVVAVFGIIDGDTPDDEGAVARSELLKGVAGSLTNPKRTAAPKAEGILKDDTVSGSVRVGGRDRLVNVTAILVHDAASAGQEFEKRYAALTTKADFVVYDGHSGLGANINALTSNMGATAGKYQLAYLYGCQTLAYLGPAMHEKRIALNGAERDPEGTKFLDVIATGLPALGDDARSTLKVYNAMLHPEAPKTFNELLDGMWTSHLPVVFGEHDNAFKR